MLLRLCIGNLAMYSEVFIIVIVKLEESSSLLVYLRKYNWYAKEFKYINSCQNLKIFLCLTLETTDFNNNYKNEHTM